MPYFKDEELIEKAKKRDKEAYKALFERYNGKILNYLYRYMGDYHKAEEVTIDTFLDVYNRLPDYKEEGKFLSWVYKIAINFAKKEFRKRKAKEISLDSPISETKNVTIGDFLGDNKLRPDNALIKDELSKVIEKIMASLDEKYRNVLLLCDMQEMSYEEAALALKCSKITVGTRLNRARKMLHEALKKKGYDL